MTTSVFPRWANDNTPPFVLRQAESIAAAGWQVTVLAPHADGALRHEKRGSINIVRFGYLWPPKLQGLFYEGGMLVQLRKHPQRKWQLPFMLVAQIMATRKLCNAKQFDLIHAHSLLPQGFTALYNGRLPVVATSHGNDVFGLKEGGLYGHLKRKVASEVAALTANSSETEKALLRLGANAERVHRVPASPNISKPEASEVAKIRAQYPPNAKLVFFAGRLIEEKGVGDLIQAFSQLAMPEAHLIIAGQGADRDRFEKQAQNGSLAKRIEFIGWQDKDALANYLAAVDLFVGPSKPRADGWVEAQGLVFAEAMAAGLPVIATRCGGIPDMIIDGQTGLLTSPGDPKALADAMQKLLTESELRTRIIEQAKRHFSEQFSPEVVTQKLLAVYATIKRSNA